MAKIKWYKRDPHTSLTSMMQLSLEERGALQTVIDLIYSNEGKVINDDRFLSGWMRCDVRIWKRIKSTLIALKLLYIDGDFLKSCDTDEGVHDTLQRVTSAKQAANMRWDKSKDEIKQNNNLGDAVVLRELMLTTTTPTTREERKKEDNKLSSKENDLFGEKKPAPNPTARGSRFNITEIPLEWKTFCKTENPFLNETKLFEEFRDYWISIAGQKAVKADWFATWRNWVRRAGNNYQKPQNIPIKQKSNVITL